jgi:DNA-binding NarL/FixJ family response regulator
VILDDDDILLREGVASLFVESGFDVIGQAAEASELTSLVREHEPDVVIVVIRMPPTHSMEGLDAARTIGASFPIRRSSSFRRTPGSSTRSTCTAS